LSLAFSGDTARDTSIWHALHIVIGQGRGKEFDMAIHDWPEAERPRERFVQYGAAALSDAELLAIIIGSGTRSRSAVDIGRSLLSRFGSLRELLTADRKSCLRHLGIGPVRFVMLQAALELARRHYLQPLKAGPALNAPGSARDYLVSQLRDRKYEVFCCMHVDTQNRLIAFEELFRGTIDTANVYAREVARQAVIHNSTGVILVHNHPSGVAEPSSADRMATEQIRATLALIDVRLVDHLIVADGQCISFAERGLL
jgi:DNA repair protein RadC